MLCAAQVHTHSHITQNIPYRQEPRAGPTEDTNLEPVDREKWRGSCGGASITNVDFRAPYRHSTHNYAGTTHTSSETWTRVFFFRTFGVQTHNASFHYTRAQVQNARARNSRAHTHTDTHSEANAYILNDRAQAKGKRPKTSHHNREPNAIPRLAVALEIQFQIIRQWKVAGSSSC